MNTEIITNMIKEVGKTLEKNSPTILAFLGVSGVVTTVGLTIKATNDFVQKRDEGTEEEPKWKRIVLCYFPVAIAGGITIACIIGSNSINAKRNLALVGAYKLSEETLKSYKDKIVEAVGGPKAKSVDEAVKTEMAKVDRTIIFGDSDIECFEFLTGRRFKISMIDLRDGLAQANRILFNEDHLSLNDLYDEIGIGATPLTSEFGWDLQTTGGPIELDIGSMLSDDGRPILTIGFDPAPEPRRM